jgi:outer membrane protein assembly factor BamB
LPNSHNAVPSSFLFPHSEIIKLSPHVGLKQMKPQRSEFKWRVVFIAFAFLCEVQGIAERSQKADSETCIANLKHIDAVKFSYAMEQHKFAGDNVEFSDLVGAYMKKLDSCPSGGKYSANPIGFPPTCTIANHVLPPPSEWTPKGTYWADWPHWLGPTRNCRAGMFERSPPRLPAELKPLWRLPIGGGFSSPVVATDKLVYFDENGTNEIAHLLDAKTGKELWQTSIAGRYADEWSAGPRSTPFIDGDCVYAQSCNGEFRCLNLADGKIIWSTSFEKDWGVKFLGSKANEGTAARRGNNGSGLADGDAVIVPVGSTNGAALVCFNKFNGKVIWKAGEDEAAYSSPQVATLAGTKQVVYLSADALMGVERANGKILWRVPLKTNAKRHAATPVVFGDNVVVNSHTFGLLCFKISKTNDGFKAEQAWANHEMKINLATPVFVDGFLYSHGPSKNFVCVDSKTGELKWQQPGFGKDNSSTIAVGKNLLVLTDDGQLFLLEANPVKYVELGRAQVCGKNWNFPAYANGKLYVRDARELMSYDLLH